MVLDEQIGWKSGLGGALERMFDWDTRSRRIGKDCVKEKKEKLIPTDHTTYSGDYKNLKGRKKRMATGIKNFGERESIEIYKPQVYNPPIQQFLVLPYCSNNKRVPKKKKGSVVQRHKHNIPYPINQPPRAPKPPMQFLFPIPQHTAVQRPLFPEVPACMSYVHLSRSLRFHHQPRYPTSPPTFIDQNCH